MLLVGSLYRIHDNNCALVRYLGDDTYQCLDIKNGEIVTRKNDTTSKQYLTPQPPPPIIWTVPPTRKRRYISGDAVIVLDWGVYTIRPIRTMFIKYRDEDMCYLKWYGASPVPLSIIRNANYLICDANCRRAVLCWLLVARKLCSKDIRRIIGQLSWETRDEREWEELALEL